MSQLSVLLQETARRETEVRTILGLLREQMEDFEGGRRSRTVSLKERLGFKGGFGCCGATWGFRPTATISAGDDEQIEIITAAAAGAAQNPSPGRVDPEAYSSSSGMNLAAALAAERQLRESNMEVSVSSGGGGGGTPVRVSLMRLLEETEAGGGEIEREKEREAGNDTVCCVCMVRKKGAAFIPCGHTYCRVCSREVWVNRGNCPLCNRSILEILDIF